MGANAQTTVPDFVAETVLTAAKLDISAATGVPVFATTVTRDAAFGGANKVLAEGQTCYLESTNVVQYYDGAAWLAVGASSGLTLITAQPFTTMATVSMAAGIFSATYKNYLVELEISATSGDQNISLRFNASGTPVTTSNYDAGICAARVNGVLTGLGSSGVSSALIGTILENRSAAFAFNVIAPMAATFSNVTIAGMGAAPGVGTAALTGSAILTVAAAHDGLTWFVSGTITGTYRVYGLADS